MPAQETDGGEATWEGSFARRLSYGDARLDIGYVAFQSNDRCESYAATVALTGPNLTATQSRAFGAVKKNTCHVEKEPASVDPRGDGSSDHPLHR